MLHGRSREIVVVERLLDTVATGRHRVLVVDGAAGIGKSALLGGVVETAGALGFRVFAAAAEPAEQGRPFAALRRMAGLDGRAGAPGRMGSSRPAAELAEWLASVDQPDRWRDPAVELGFRVADATVELVEHLAGDGPVLLVLDDVQWADPLTMRVLDAVHRRLTGLPVGLVLALRAGAENADELLGGLGEGSATLTLRPLPDDAVGAMVDDLTGARAGGRLTRQLAKAGGNPFYVTELVRVLGDEGLLTVTGGVVESSAEELPEGLGQTVLRRLRLLPDETVELLRLAAILGQSFSVAELAVVTRLGAVELTRRLGPALAAHALRGQDDELAFAHPLTWESIYHDQPVAIRLAVHREVAGLLGAAGVAPARVVRHFALGARPGDTEAVTWLCRAAKDVAPGSPATAAELLGRALELAGHTDTIVAELVPLLVVIGEVDQARDLTDRALVRGVRAGVESRLRVGLTHVLMRRGHVGDAKVQALRLLELAAAAGVADLVGGIAGYVLVAAGDADRAAELAERALTAGVAGGHELVVATALMTLTWTHAAHGRIEDAVAAGERAVAATEDCTASMSALLFPHCALGAALLQADRFADAERSFRDGLARAERTAAPGSMVYHQAGIAAARFFGDDWDEAVSEAETALDVADKTATSWTLLPSAVLARIAVARDDLATARSVVADALRAPEAGHLTMTIDWLYWAHAVVLDAAGEPDKAVAAAERAWRSLPTMRDLIGNRVAPVDCTRIALAAGNRALAAEIAEGMALVAAGDRPVSLGAAADHCRALVTGDGDLLRSVVDRLRGTPRRYQWAMANEDGALLAGEDRDGSRVLFAEALAAYRQLGTDRDAARVSAAMRARGFRPAAGVRQDGTALTRTERAVAGLVAEGLSNPGIAQRLYISRHTAETHMKHIFAKLGLSSRTELAALVAGGGLDK